jgi:glutaredoxin
VVVYSRPGCHLCEEAIDQIRAMAADRPGLELEVIDIERDDDLMKRYLERIPVVETGGEVVSELVFDPALLRSRLRIA